MPQGQGHRNSRDMAIDRQQSSHINRQGVHTRMEGQAVRAALAVSHVVSNGELRWELVWFRGMGRGMRLGPLDVSQGMLPTRLLYQQDKQPQTNAQAPAQQGVGRRGKPGRTCRHAVSIRQCRECC